VVILDYNGEFILRVPRGEANVHALRTEEGWNYSRTASTNGEAILFTKEPYLAVGHWDYGTPAAKAVLAAIRRELEASWAPTTSFQAKVPYGEKLAPFQNADVEYALRRQNALIADAPGLGKSPTAMAIDNEIGAEYTTIICPASIRLQWAQVVRRWTTRPFPYYTYPILKGEKGVHPAAHFTIVSYDLARTEPIGRALSKIRTDHLIVDEAHYAKENTSQRARAIFGGGEDRKFDPIVANASRTTLLTGTPLPNRPREAYTITRGICFDAIDFMSEDHFKERFNPSVTREVMRRDGTRAMIVDERSGRHGELQARMRANFMARHEKRGPNGVGHQLGIMDLPKINVVHVEESAAVRKALEAEELLGLDPDNWEASINEPSVFGAIATARRLMAEAIAPFAASYVVDIMEGGEDKLFVAAHHISVLDLLQTKLLKYGLRRIDGSTSAAAKESRKQEFIDDPSVRVLLVNTQSGGTGLDGVQLVCSHGVAVEPDWVMGTNQQLIDRLDRGGQTDHVQFDFLLVPGSLGEKILAKAIGKGQTVFKALDRRF
jgi:SNF2 family DNA or RNA helicase